MMEIDNSKEINQTMKCSNISAKINRIVIALVLLVGTGISGVATEEPPDCCEVEPTTIQIVLPIGTPINSGPEGDVLVFTGKPLGTTTVSNCAPGEYPVHKAIILDSEGGRDEHFVLVSAVSQMTPVKPGTKLRKLIHLGTCGSDAFDKYIGEVK